MKHNKVEVFFGALIIAVAVGFFAYAYQKSDIVKTDQNSYVARFNAIDGLVVGSDVRLSGVKVGTILNAKVDPKTFLAEVVLSVEHGILLPTDTAVQVVSDGLLGGKYLSISPGGDEENLKPGERIKHTQSSVNLEELIGKAVFSNSDKN